MSGLFPFIEVEINGAPSNQIFYDRLISATITDAPGQDSDSIDLEFDDSPDPETGNYILEIPPENAEIWISFGYRDTGASKMGLFTLDQPEDGHEETSFMRLSGRAADMSGDLKEALSEHWDDTTIGKVIEELAKRHNLDAQISPSLASIPLEYYSRINQSMLGFGTDLADQLGGIFAVKGGKMLLLKRGEGKDAKGNDLSPIIIDRSECSSWGFSGFPRQLFGQVETEWFDRAKGRYIRETAATGLDSTVKRRMQHPYPSKEFAKRAAQAEGERLSRESAKGQMTLPGRPEIVAEMPLTLTSFRPGRNGFWKVDTARHVYQDTYTTEVDIEAPEGGRKEE